MGDWKKDAGLRDHKYHVRQFLRLDAYGRMTVKTLIQRESLRCLEQGTEQDISNIKIGIKTVSDDEA